MCSSGNCDMAGLISGPVGNLVGIGIKALVNGAPIGPRCSETLKKPTEQEMVKQFYDNVEAHLKGALQVLQPALEIKKILTGESKSADRERPAVSSQPTIQYYSPQYLLKSRESACQTRCCGSRKSTSCLTTQKSCSKVPSSHCSKKEKSNEKYTSQLKTSSSQSKSSSFNSYCKSESEEKSFKTSTKLLKSKQHPKTCCMCDKSLKNNIILALLPCEHLFCYTCLAIGSSRRCRRCNKYYDMKNVSQIFH